MRVKAVELVAHAIQCDRLGCDQTVILRNEISRPERWFAMTLRRDFKKTRVVSGELWFCSKECLVNAMNWQLSNLMVTESKG